MLQGVSVKRELSPATGGFSHVLPRGGNFGTNGGMKKQDLRPSPGSHMAAFGGAESPDGRILGAAQQTFLSAVGSVGSPPKKAPSPGRDSPAGDKDSPGGGGGRWSKEEDALLIAGVDEVGAKNWKKISKEHFKDSRTDVQCLHRWQKVLKPGLVKGPWTKDEDACILACISSGITKWSEIAARIPGRIGKQCRERWFNHLDPTVKKGPWEPYEDQILVQSQKAMGNRWYAHRLRPRHHCYH